LAPAPASQAETRANESSEKVPSTSDNTNPLSSLWNSLDRLVQQLDSLGSADTAAGAVVPPVAPGAGEISVPTPPEQEAPAPFARPEGEQGARLAPEQQEWAGSLLRLNSVPRELMFSRNLPGLPLAVKGSAGRWRDVGSALATALVLA